MNYIQLIVGILVGLSGGLAWSLFAPAGARQKAQRILDDAQRESDNRKKETEVALGQMELERKQKIDNHLQQSRNAIHQRERELDGTENQLAQRERDLQAEQKTVAKTQNRLKVHVDQARQTEKDIRKVLEDKKKKLHAVTGLSVEEATAQLLELLESELTEEVGTRILDHEKKVKELCEKQSRDILSITMQRLASAHTANTTTGTIDIPNDEMKGRIIGREGRNIRTFEKETGIDLIIDDTPGVVVISGFDPVRREIAGLALEKLIADGRIHPSRIEEIVKETKSEIDAVIRSKGIEAAQEVDVHDLDDRVIEMLGRLHYRTSYSQNVLRHSVEVAFHSGMLAETMGLDPQLSRRCGLLHDIGKAADHDMEGGHPKIGADLLKRAGECEEVVHAALGHHDQIVVEHPYTVIVATADACSASRPGARRESLDRYVKRMTELETLAFSVDGVKEAYAVQAGREVRVMVGSEDLTDAKAARICRDIAASYSENLTFPGEIKVVVIRESRFTELAK